MVKCFEEGFLPFYSHEYSDDHHDYEEVMRVILRTIRIIVNMTPEDVREILKSGKRYFRTQEEIRNNVFLEDTEEKNGFE